VRNRALDALIRSPEERRVPFESLMPRRVRNILLVSSLYDSFTFEEDGRLTELLISDFLELNLRYAPRIEQVATAREALAKLRSDSFDLVISMLRIGEMDVQDFGRAVHELDPDLPVVLLAFNTRELDLFEAQRDLSEIDRVFVWLGDVRIFLAIIKYIEDRLNAWHDARTAGIRVIILIEDSVRFYSSYLPMLYTEVVEQTQNLMSDGVNRMQKLVRMRARPKILLANSFEEGLSLFHRYREYLLGVITDLRFPRAGKLDPEAGYDFAKMIRSTTAGIPVLIQTSTGDEEQTASIGASFVNKNSPNLLHGVREFMRDHLGFGDFLFRTPDGKTVARAGDLRALEECLETLPEESLMFHAGRNDFSTWLMARTEFDLAKALRRRKVEEFQGAEEIRRLLVSVLKFRREQARAGVVAEFSKGSFEASSGFVRIGTGSLGGKGRGLAFINSVFNSYKLEGYFPGVRLFVPPTAVLATGVFDEFIENSGLDSFIAEEPDDEAVTRAFMARELPGHAVEDLRTFIDKVRYPLAVRSSSLLEDACYQPFAGIYRTYMIPNDNADPETRLEELCNAIKLVYASTYYEESRAYIESTPNRLEEEKMAVVIQQVVGRRYGRYLYPNFAGVARSVNFYPAEGMQPEDGIASVALGMGKMVVDGGRCLRFSPAHPTKPLQFTSPKDILQNAQVSFLALDMGLCGPKKDAAGEAEFNIPELGLDTAEEHGTLAPVGSVYSPANDMIYDGIGREGEQLVSMAGVLKGKVFPLAKVLSFLLQVGRAGFSCPVEMEFAVTLRPTREEAHEFGFLQIRPLVTGTDFQDFDLSDVDPADTICISHQVLGDGILDEVRDIVCVRRDTFDRSKTREIAQEIGEFNARLKKEDRPYILIGPGRWGSADHWLGIPVKWRQINGVSCIVETPMEDIQVDPSQGSHFFQNITAFGIYYLTIDAKEHSGLIDYEWLNAQPHESASEHTRLLSFENPVRIAVNSRAGEGLLVKPGAGRAE